MQNLSNKELQKIKGGAMSIGSWAFIGGVISFVIGIVDGYTNPKRCNN